MGRSWFTLGLFVAVAACSPTTAPYQCETNDQCRLAGETGNCEPEGFCSFTDPTCDSGRRFEPTAGVFGGQCVPSGPPDAAPCGALNMACCPGDNACTDNAFCDGGTCKQCVTDVGIGRRHSCYLRFDGVVLCAGENMQGQLGFGIAGAAQATAVEVRDSTNGEIIRDATAVAAGREHSCMVRAGGAVWCWGANFSGQLGDNTMMNRPAAVPVRRAGTLAPLVDQARVVAADQTSCSVDEAGQIACWGASNGGIFGDGTQFMNRPTASEVKVAMGGANFTGAVEVTLGTVHICARTQAGELFCWGNGGMVGDNTFNSRLFPTRILPNADLTATVTSVSVGRFHSCAAQSDNKITCWGQPGFGRLGNGTGFSAPFELVPTEITLPDMSKLSGASVQAGALSCSLTADGGALCWGSNQYGQTGTGTGGSVPTPVLDERGASPIVGIQRLVAHYAHACAFMSTGKLLCWGRNTEGQHADGTTRNYGFPSRAGPSCQ